MTPIRRAPATSPSPVRHALQRHVDAGALPGAVALTSRGGRVETVAVGTLDTEGTAPMTPDTIFRIASMTKPIVAAATMQLVDEGRLGLQDPISTWLPELAAPAVVRTPDAPVDDLVPAERPITVLDLLSSRAGWGFASDFSLPALGPLFRLQPDGREPQRPPAPDAWLAALARVPLLHQPGAAWLYNTCSDLQGVLVSRVTGRPLPEVLAERLLEPLGMTDTGFVVPEGDRHRFASYYRAVEDGELELADAPDGDWSTAPAFPSGAGGLVSTAADWLAFARMLLAGGTTADGRRLLGEESVARMTTDSTTAETRASGALFLDGQGWGFGGSVDIARIDPWNVPGRYGWVGGTGTSGHLVPSSGDVTIVLTQLAMGGPELQPTLRDAWTAAAAG